MRQTQASATTKGRTCQRQELIENCCKAPRWLKIQPWAGSTGVTCCRAKASCTQPAPSVTTGRAHLSRRDTGHGRERSGFTAPLLTNNFCNIYTLWYRSVHQHCPVANPKHNDILWSWQTACTVTPKAVVIKCNSNVI